MTETPTFGGTPLSTHEAVLWALDPRNDNGTPEAINVMAYNYDQDCPNVADHTFVAIHNDSDPRLCYMDEVCECWDGITAEDVETWTDDGVVDEEGFAEWGPFELVFDIDPGLPRA